MPRKPGPDPSQRLDPPASTRPGDDTPLRVLSFATDAAAPLQLPPVLPLGWETPAPPPPPELTGDDAAIVGRAYRADAGHVGNWEKGTIIPAGTFADPAWVRHLLQKRFITAVESER